MIEKIEPPELYTERGIIIKEVEKQVIIDKINEIIDYINSRESEYKVNE